MTGERMRISDTTYRVVQTETGYAIECQQYGQPTFYCGRDGYWCRSARNATAYTEYAAAVAAANRMQ